MRKKESFSKDNQKLLKGNKNVKVGMDGIYVGSVKLCPL